ncbi:MAG: hypothetical protein GY898_11535 [Proteobacteria bacterium]|nr:hypothetical protein [Pseudomonadota bacterium]
MPAVLILLLSSCNPYDLLIHDRFEQAAFNSDVDILWVVDNSNSMARIQEEVQANFGAFIDTFANVGTDDGTELDYNTITDATVAWAEFLRNQERFLNYNMGVTTTNVDDGGNGNQGNIRSLASLGGPSCESPHVLSPQSEDVLGDFVDLVDVGVAGSGSEKGLMASAFSLCKGKPASWWDSLEDNFDVDDPVRRLCGLIPAADRTCNDGFFREGAASVVIIVSDEGDETEIQAGLPPQDELERCVLDHGEDPFFGECDCKLSWWLEFFNGIGQPVIFATIAPTYQAFSDDVALCDGATANYPGPCNAFGSSICSVDFYQEAACLTGGLFTPIEEKDDPENPQSTCNTADFDQALRSIGALISNLSRGWVLSAIPDPETIVVVKTEGECSEDDPAPCVVSPLDESPSGGWFYRPATRSIAFTGEAVPQYDDVIDIYYLPQHDRHDQVGRPLPF